VDVAFEALSGANGVWLCDTPLLGHMKSHADCLSVTGAAKVNLLGRDPCQASRAFGHYLVRF
jgi:hypothetical protein